MAHFFNSLLLGSTGGDLLKAYFAAGETSQRKAEAATTVVVDRLLGLFAMLLCSVMALLNWNIVMSQQRFMAVMLVVLVMFPERTNSGAFILGRPTKPRLKFESLLARLPRGDALVRCIEACRAFGENPGFLPRVLWSMLLSLACGCKLLRWLGASRDGPASAGADADRPSDHLHQRTANHAKWNRRPHLRLAALIRRSASRTNRRDALDPRVCG